MTDWREQRWQVGAAVMEPGKGGISRVIRMSAQALADAGAEVRSVSLLDRDCETVAGARARTVRGNRLRFALDMHRAALGRDWFLYDSVGVARAHPALWPLRRPYCVWIHGVEVWDSLSPNRARALTQAQVVLANSRFTLDRFQDRHFPLARAQVCPLATEGDERPTGAAAGGADPVALLVGRVDRDNFRKGHAEVIEAWPRVVSAVPGARLLLAGSGDGMARLKALVAACPAQDSIEILGFVPESQMPALWSRARVFVQPSWKEGFGLVYIEAMRHGVPVIASIHDAAQEVNVHDETGFNVDLTRPDDLVSRMVTLLSRPDQAQRMGAAGRARWQAQFRYSAFRDRFVACLDKGIHPLRRSGT